MSDSDQDIKADIDLDKQLALVFTSGSGGRAKAVCHSMRSLISSAQSTVEFYELNSKSCWLLSLGLFHIGGLMIPMRMLICNGSIELLEHSLDAQIKLGMSNIVSLVPTQLIRLLEMNIDLSKMYLLMIGGAKVENWLFDRCESLKLPISITYGSSETGAQISGTSISDYSKNGAEILPGKDLSLDDNGVLIVRSNSLFLGYFFEKKFHDPKIDLSFVTSDKAKIKNGRLLILGRSDRVFQFGGENISPEMIESKLYESLDYELLILPKKDKEYGNIIVLVIRSYEKPDIKKVEKAVSYLSGLLKPREIFWHSNKGINAKLSANYYAELLSGSDFDPLVKII